MTTFTINFTDLIGNFWTMDWEPTTSKKKNLTDSDIHAVVHFIKTGSWPKNATAAAKNCYESLATEIANTILEEALTSRSRCEAIANKMADAYRTATFSKKGMDLFKQCLSMTEEAPTPEKVELLNKRLKKIIKFENLFAVKFEDDENWLVDVPIEMKCCICGNPIGNNYQNHNPYPVRPESWYGDKENRCCSDCNQRIVIPSRIRYGRSDKVHRAFIKLDYEEILNFVA